MYSGSFIADSKTSRGNSFNIDTGLWPLSFHAILSSILKSIRAPGCQLHQRLYARSESPDSLSGMPGNCSLLFSTGPPWLYDDIDHIARLFIAIVSKKLQLNTIDKINYQKDSNRRNRYSKEYIEQERWLIAIFVDLPFDLFVSNKCKYAH